MACTLWVNIILLNTSVWALYMPNVTILRRTRAEKGGHPSTQQHHSLTIWNCMRVLLSTWSTGYDVKSTTDWPTSTQIMKLPNGTWPKLNLAYPSPKDVCTICFMSIRALFYSKEKNKCFPLNVSWFLVLVSSVKSAKCYAFSLFKFECYACCVLWARM